MDTASPLQIHYEDNHLIAVEKPAGMLTQGDASGAVSLMDMVKDYIKTRYNKPGNVFLGMVHRLDKPVSGIVMFAKTSKGASRLSRSFASRETLKLYLALVKQQGKEDKYAVSESQWITVEQFLRRENNRSVIYDNPRDGAKNVSLSYKQVTRGKDYRLFAVNLHTGRKHQIRAQLAHAGFPIVNDTAYGAGKDGPAGKIGLHAYFLRIPHPTKKISVDILSEPPDFITGRLSCNNIEELINEIAGDS